MTALKRPPRTGTKHGLGGHTDLGPSSDAICWWSWALTWNQWASTSSFVKWEYPQGLLWGGHKCTQTEDAGLNKPPMCLTFGLLIAGTTTRHGSVAESEQWLGTQTTRQGTSSLSWAHQVPRCSFRTLEIKVWVLWVTDSRIMWAQWLEFLRLHFLIWDIPTLDSGIADTAFFL